MAVTSRHSQEGVILVVDDQRIVLQALQRVLETHGFRTMGVSSGWGAIEVLRSDTPVACAVVDVVLSDISGTEVLQRARQLRPALPLIAMSGYGEHVPGLSSQPAADGYLSKPFDTAHLVAMITGLLEKRAHTGETRDVRPERPGRGIRPEDGSTE